MDKPLTYKDAGVDITKGDNFIAQIKKMVASTYNSRVKSGIGGFACLYEMGDKYLVAGTDGVGTKLKIAQQLNIHNTIGIDLVAMCVNDVICTGARPLFFLDYISTGKLNLTTSKSIIEGIVEGCQQSQMALIGGETAEMPDLYQTDEYDLAGFAIGEVEKDKVIDGKKVEAGDHIIGVASSGFHSNGFSLIRKLIKPDETELLKKCLIPTRIYASLVSDLMDKFPGQIRGIAHITGGGFDNISRINEAFAYKIEHYPQPLEIVSLIAKRSQLPAEELRRTFNMGVGLVLISPPDISSEIISFLGNDSCLIGSVYSK